MSSDFWHDIVIKWGKKQTFASGSHCHVQTLNGVLETAKDALIQGKSIKNAIPLLWCLSMWWILIVFNKVSSYVIDFLSPSHFSKYILCSIIWIFGAPALFRSMTQFAFYHICLLTLKPFYGLLHRNGVHFLFPIWKSCETSSS